MPLGDGKLDHLSRDLRELLREYMNQVIARYGEDVRTILLYGTVVKPDFQPGRSNVNVLLVMADLQVENFSRYVDIHKHWSKERFVVPLFFTDEDIRISASMFPLEFLEMSAQYCVLHGPDPFQGTIPDLTHFSYQCVQELVGNLVRVRQRFIEGGGTSETVQALLPLSITAVLPALKGWLRERGQVDSDSTEQFLEKAEKLLHRDCSPLLEAWQLKNGLISPGQYELPRLFERYVLTLDSIVREATKGFTGV